jgi:hypothetical protein
VFTLVLGVAMWRHLAAGMIAGLAMGCSSLEGHRIDPNITPERAREKIVTYMKANNLTYHSMVVTIVNTSGPSHAEYVMTSLQADAELCGVIMEERMTGRIGYNGGWTAKSSRVCLPYTAIAAVRASKETSMDRPNAALASVLHVMALPFVVPAAIVAGGGVGQ